jgi:hypothetical protein
LEIEIGSFASSFEKRKKKRSSSSKDARMNDPAPSTLFRGDSWVFPVSVKKKQ